MKKRKVAVIATGFTGQQHTEAIRRIPGNEVAALVDPHVAALKAKGQALGVEALYTDYKRMIDEIRPDVIHNCTPNGMHYEINKYALERGIHVYCEKPLALTVAQGEELAHLAAQNHLAAGVNFNYRNNAMVQEMRARVASGAVGRVFHVTGQYLQDWMMLDTDYNWRLTADMGGASRTIADIGSHWFDTAQCAMGQNIVAVRAQTLTVHPFRKKPAQEVETFAKAQKSNYTLVPINTEDAAFLLVRFADGTLGSVTLSQVSGGHLNDFRLEIAGEKCALEWQQERCDTLTVGTREFGIQTLRTAPGSMTGDANRYTCLPGGHPDGWADALKNAVSEFYTSIENGTFAQTGMTYATFADGARIMKLVDACMQSAKSGEWAEVRE
ncbi:MAG: Gfo/Idh/MocA family oxidoreductase [Gemmiger sp.]|nr:Gfo/Idh/MocA family oxidoreductase [Gemmiger sp.]